MQWSLRLRAAERGIWKSAQLRRMLADAGLEISAGKMSSWWAGTPPTMRLEELDQTLTVLEEKIFAALWTAADQSEVTSLREQATRELAPYRGKMQAVQIKQVQQQFLQKKLLEARRLPRLSLFYMSLG